MFKKIIPLMMLVCLAACVNTPETGGTVSTMSGNCCEKHGCCGSTSCTCCKENMCASCKKGVGETQMCPGRMKAM